MPEADPGSQRERIDVNYCHPLQRCKRWLAVRCNGGLCRDAVKLRGKGWGCSHTHVYHNGSMAGASPGAVCVQHRLGWIG